MKHHKDNLAIFDHYAKESRANAFSENTLVFIEQTKTLNIPVIKHSTPISDKTNLSLNSEGNEDLGTWIYELGLLLDKKNTIKRGYKCTENRNSYK